MRSSILGLFAFLALALIAFSGCQKSAQSVGDEWLALMTELCDAMESGNAKAKVDALKSRMETLVKRMQAMNQDELKAAMSKRQDEVEKLMMRLMTAVQKNPALMQGLKFPGAPPGK